MNVAGLLNQIGNFFTPEVVWTILWVASGLFTLVVLVLMRTRWGQARPLVKCIILSVLAHALLMGYAQMTRLFEGTSYGRDRDYGEDVRTVSPVIPDELNATRPSNQELQPWEKFEPEDTISPNDLALDRETVDLDTPPTRRDVDLPENFTDGIPLLEPTVHDTLQPGDFSLPMQPKQQRTTGLKAPEIDAPTPQRQENQPTNQPDGQPLDRPQAPGDAIETPQRNVPTDLPNDLQAGPDLNRLAALADNSPNPDAFGRLSDENDAAMPNSQAHKIRSQNPAVASGVPIEGLTGDQVASADTTNNPTPPSGGDGNAENQTARNAGDAAAGQAKQLINGRNLPEIYKLRVLDDRLRVAEQNGGNRQTEAAVEAALAWLVANQEADGRWDASRHGAGRETRVFGHDRDGAGENSDTGITGLALLALMGAGHTHLEGEYRENVQKGLEFLLRSQGRDGDMSGGAKTFAATYCHSMATFAIAEAYDVTGDDRLKWWVQKAVGYTLASQNEKDGGWRYRPGDSGDTSQFGWQVMALKAAAQAGLEVPNKSRVGMRTFLGKVSSGRHGGLASYRPIEAVSETMTAEALACRFFLGVPRDDPSIDEAANYLLKHRPGQGKINFYYWYYGTLAMQQLHDERWEAWNLAMQTQLVKAQAKSGRHKGTWEPEDSVWGGYGGRVYTTAVGALILESYYRYAPK